MQSMSDTKLIIPGAETKEAESEYEFLSPQLAAYISSSVRQEIMDANPGIDPNALVIGDTVAIPGVNVERSGSFFRNLVGGGTKGQCWHDCGIAQGLVGHARRCHAAPLRLAAQRLRTAARFSPAHAHATLMPMPHARATCTCHAT